VPSLCLSLASLGKKFVFIYKWHSKQDTLLSLTHILGHREGRQQDVEVGRAVHEQLVRKRQRGRCDPLRTALDTCRKENASLSFLLVNFSFCLSRACLGTMMIVLYRKLAQKKAFSAPPSMSRCCVTATVEMLSKPFPFSARCMAPSRAAASPRMPSAGLTRSATAAFSAGSRNLPAHTHTHRNQIISADKFPGNQTLLMQQLAGMRPSSRQG
jgi:hypothetical protein